MTLGIIDAGGGFRGVYAAGVLDYCMEKNIKFDLGIGISAGSANLISYAAGQKGRNYKFFTEYGLRKEYASMRNFIKKKSFVDLDYIYSTLSNSDGENPLNYEAFLQNPMRYYVVTTDANTGTPVFFDRTAIHKNNYDVLKASCAIPYVCQPYSINGIPYYDGALGNPVPIKEAFALGCDKVILLLTRPKDQLRLSGHDPKLAKMIQSKYPHAAEQLRQRANKYNAGVALAKAYEMDGHVLIIAPEDTFGVNTLTRDAVKLKQLYQAGFEDGKKIERYLSESEKENG